MVMEREKMKYSKKIDKLYLDYVKQYRRKDTTFEMNVIKQMIEQLENDNDYADSEKQIICKYLCDRYFACMSKWKEKIEERKKQGLWY